MSERILKALMQMFAIIARVDGITNNGREVVQLFLKQQLNQELVEQYLVIFDDFLEGLHQTSKRKDGSEKRTSMNSVKVLRICTQINAELTQKQKIVVLIRLLEFVNSNQEISPQELEFVFTVSETFNIEEEEFNRCMSFVKMGSETVPDSDKILIIDNVKNPRLNKTKHIYSETLSGQLRVLNIPSVTMYAIRYFGSSDLSLNGQLMTGDRIYILTQGSSIRSPKVQPIYYSDIISSFLSDESKSKITFIAKDIDYKFKSGKVGLHNINIAEESGKLIGIMGGSGAGKSTLLNVLNGNEKPSKGEILINGINIHTEHLKIEGAIGHVSQDDLLIEELTVFQNLFYNAKLCFGNLSDLEITKLVLNLLANIGLYETKDLKVGSPLDKKISGGQRKRLNIALELIREPSVLFVDEPTSGLSSRDSENIMDLLKELALKGKLIFVVIHQPSSEIFKMFDKLMILDVGGYPIYYGNPVDAVIYFKTIVNHVNCNDSECVVCGNVNPEQIFNIIEAKVLDEYGNLTYNRKISPLEWNEKYKNEIELKISEADTEHTEIPAGIFKIPSKLKQLKVFVVRDVLSKLTNTQYLIINLFESPLLAFILAYLVKYYNTDISNTTGYIFRENENIPAYIFMSVVVALFIGLTVSAEEIIRDRKIRKRESFLNLSKGSYLISKIGIMFVLSAIQTFLFVIVGNTVLQIHGMYLDYWLVLFTTSCFANMLGLNISASFNSAITIYILIPFLIIPQLLLSGVIVKFDKLNPSITSQNEVPFAGQVMTSRWAFEALAVDQFMDNAYEKPLYKFDKYMSIASFKKDYWISNLNGKVDECENDLKDTSNAAVVKQNLLVLKHEIAKEMNYTVDIKFNYLDSLTPTAFTTHIASVTRDYLKKISDYYIQLWNNASNQRDNLITKWNATPQGKEAFLKLKNENENDNLSDLVTNHNDLNKILEEKGMLIQHADPVFLDPIYSDLGNAQFFAPRKKILGNYYNTFWVNILVIWMMSLGLMFTLYYNVLRKIIRSMEYFFDKIFSKKIKA
ncbi:MAG TPA: ATP-binding cassette domain-containing protein [Bacteroidia bacterium]|nr:ATP-binding cassette domain-containing protein [Bacteroidia bacterium]